MAKLQDPTTTLQTWLHNFYIKPVSIEVRKEVVKKSLRNKTVFYVSSNDPLWPDCLEAARSKADFKLLYTQLKLRFPTAIVPNLPRFDSKVDEISMLELYLEKLFANQFFRNDVALTDFVDGSFRDYRQTKLKDRQASEGSYRWLRVRVVAEVVVPAVPLSSAGRDMHETN